MVTLGLQFFDEKMLKLEIITMRSLPNFHVDHVPRKKKIF